MNAFRQGNQISRFFRNYTQNATVGISLGLLGFILLHNSLIDVPDVGRSYEGPLIAVNLASALACVILSFLTLSRRIDTSRALEAAMCAGFLLAIALTFVTGVVWGDELWNTCGYTMAIIVAAGITLRKTPAFASMLLLLFAGWAVAAATTSGQGDLERDGTNMVIIAALISTASFALLKLERGTHARTTLRLETQLDYDVLTGILNRRGFAARLASLRGSIGETGTVWYAYVDVDHFKRINDEMGHDHGDDVLRVIARGISEACGPDAVVARWGGDEFVAVSAGKTPTESSIEETVAAALVRRDLSASVTAGMVWVTRPETFDPEAMIARADVRMYQRRDARRGTEGSRRSAAHRAA